MRIKTITITLLVMVFGIGAADLIGLRRGSSQETPDKFAKICRPMDCGFGGYEHPDNCTCQYSVLLIDFSGKGIEFTDAQNGVNFDLDTSGGTKQERVSWTVANSSAAFLFLDRNENGAVDNGYELWGNFSPQLPSSSEANGFLGLAYYDSSERGGNGDGLIDGRDAFFSKLRLWQDTNHNGVSEANELHTLAAYGVEALSLEHRESRRRDQWGNLFRYEADVYGANHRKIGTAYDVVLLRLRGPSPFKVQRNHG
ncbi:MAG TPA: hypothetical protein VN956_27140 [Pyrinomonadaceae bacterium]|nr:hypothetical protein [Pyrinomonadaceae bacterium]